MNLQTFAYFSITARKALKNSSVAPSISSRITTFNFSLPPSNEIEEQNFDILSLITSIPRSDDALIYK